MRILLVSHGLPPDSVGGVEQHVSGLAEALVAQGHEVDIFARANLPGTPQGSFEQTVEGNPRVWRTAYRWEDIDSLDASRIRLDDGERRQVLRAVEPTFGEVAIVWQGVPTRTNGRTTDKAPSPPPPLEVRLAAVTRLDST